MVANERRASYCDIDILEMASTSNALMKGPCAYLGESSARRSGWESREQRWQHGKRLSGRLEVP